MPGKQEAERTFSSLFQQGSRMRYRLLERHSFVDNRQNSVYSMRENSFGALPQPACYSDYRDPRAVRFCTFRNPNGNLAIGSLSIDPPFPSQDEACA